MLARRVLFSALIFLPFLSTGYTCALAQAAKPEAAAKGVKELPSAPEIKKLTIGTSPRDYSGEAVVYKKISTVYRYQADGTGERTLTVEAHVQSENGVHQMGLLAFTYASSNSHLDLTYVRVRKPDGTVISTPASDGQDQPTEVTRQAPFYSDLRELQLPVKSLGVGDDLEYELHETLQKPLAPGQFWDAANFAMGAVVLEESFELSFPKDKYVQVLSPKWPPAVTDEDGRKVYRWKTSQLEPTASKTSKDQAPPDPDALPSVSWTTFRDWQEIGAWYSSLARDRTSVTPEIQAKVDELIKGKTTDDEKIHAIYDYVSTQVRYIGVAFGIGRYQPHSADTVLDNQYGDCKDKHTLLAAMLKAAGYDAWPALIGSTMKFHPEIPAPSQFDHVITVVSLNGKLIWLDSTPEITPYRMLVAQIRDKQALVMPTNGPAQLMRTPADGPFPFVDEFTGTGKLDATGKLEGHIAFTMRSDNEISFREVFHALPRAQWQTATQNMSQNMGFVGTASNVDVSLPEKTATPFAYSYDYERKDYADWANHRIVPLTMSVSLFEVADDKKDKPFQLGSPRTEIHRSTIELPTTYTATMPRDVKYTTAFAEYQSAYKLDGDKYINERKLTILQREVPADKIDEYSKFVKNVEDDENQFTQLYAKGAVKIEDTASNPEADQLIQTAFADISRNDLNSARTNLRNAEQLSPRERGLQAGYAYADVAEHRLEDAVADYRKEIRNHPENAFVYRSLAALLVTMKRNDEAEQTLRDGLKIIPDDTSTVTQLSFLLVQQKKYTDASTLLEAAVKTAPDDKNLSIQAGRAEILSGKKDAGVASLRAALTDSSDPGILNDASYELADSNAELPLAEASCKKALDTLEKAAAQTTLGNLSADDLRRVNLLTATWDTMGWVYFREGNLPLAEQYVGAAWHSTEHSEVGDHLAQVYEKEGRLQDAANIYSLAAAAGTLSPDPSGDDSIHAGLKRLAAKGYTPHSKTPEEDLGKQRSVALSRLTTTAWKSQVSADFFILFSGGKTEDVQFIKGSDELRAAADELKAKGIPAVFPEGSQAKIVRRGILYCSDALKGCQFTMLLPQSTQLN
jgi:tetratricopeptide (TPR) repeat protein